MPYFDWLTHTSAQHMACCRWVMYNQHQAALLELQQSNMHTQIDLVALSQPTDQVLQRASLHAWVPTAVTCSFVFMVDTISATLSCLLPCVACLSCSREDTEAPVALQQFLAPVTCDMYACKKAMLENHNSVQQLSFCNFPRSRMSAWS